MSVTGLEVGMLLSSGQQDVGRLLGPCEKISNHENPTHGQNRGERRCYRGVMLDDAEPHSRPERVPLNPY